MASQASRAKGAVSSVVLVATPLCIFLTFSPILILSPSRLAASPAPVVVEAPERVNLGALRPTGRVNPDGTEVWVPREDSILAGSIEVDVRGDGRVIRQKVLRSLRVSDQTLGFRLSPQVEERVHPRSSTPGGGEAAPAVEPDLADSRRPEAASPSGEWR